MTLPEEIHQEESHQDVILLQETALELLQEMILTADHLPSETQVHPKTHLQEKNQAMIKETIEGETTEEETIEGIIREMIGIKMRERKRIVEIDNHRGTYSHSNLHNYIYRFSPLDSYFYLLV